MLRVLGSVDRDLPDAALVRKLDEEGLTEAKHFALLVKDGGRSLLEVAFVDRTCSFSDDVVAVVEGFLQTMASQVAWTERLQTQGRDPRIADVLDPPERREEEGTRGRVRCEQYSGLSLQTKDEGDVGSRGCWCEPAQRGRSCLLRSLGETGHRPAARS